MIEGFMKSTGSRGGHSAFINTRDPMINKKNIK